MSGACLSLACEASPATSLLSADAAPAEAAILRSLSDGGPLSDGGSLDDSDSPADASSPESNTAAGPDAALDAALGDASSDDAAAPVDASTLDAALSDGRSPSEAHAPRDAAAGNTGDTRDTASDASPGDAALPSACATRQVRDATGACVCPAEDVLCPTRGYAHFRIPLLNLAPDVELRREAGAANLPAYELSAALVFDRVSGLVWEREASSYSSFAEAWARCAALELEGRDDFRLPGRIELVTILDFAELPVAVNAFTGVVSDYHWSSSQPTFVQGSAYSVYFGAGETTIASASPGRAVSRCVAGAVTTRGAAQFEVDTESVFDHETALSWERAAAPASSWASARDRCHALGLRLPSVQELQSIIDESAHAPAIDLALFPDTAASEHWTGSLRGATPWTVDFEDGKTYADRLASEPLPSRCVGD